MNTTKTRIDLQRSVKYSCLFVLTVLFCTHSTFAKKRPRPNVILALTDEQGIGDLGCQGNPIIKTPNIDRFYTESIRLTDFHMSPMCTLTRGTIMTGRYTINNGAWATDKGRDALSNGSIIMAELFKYKGCTTGLFGKWHLGDNYSVRPTDKGFDIALQHKAGGVGKLSDYWGNSYFDDTYYVNNEPQKFKGYCTDVWFRETLRFIESSNEELIFVYLSTNPPHTPLIVEERYAAPCRDYVGTQIASAEFYGMITNLNENFGKLVQFLEEKVIADNTIQTFMTDNGSGVTQDLKIGYNKGYRGKKGWKTEDGHWVPFFIRWPDGNLKEEKT